MWVCVCAFIWVLLLLCIAVWIVCQKWRWTYIYVYRNRFYIQINASTNIYYVGKQKNDRNICAKNGRKPIHISLVDERHTEERERERINEREEDGKRRRMWRRWEVEKGILRFIFIFSANAFDDHWSNTRSLSSALALTLSHSVCVCERVFSLPHSTFSLYRSFRHLNVWLIVVSVASTLPQRWATDKPSYFFFSLSPSLRIHTHTSSLHPFFTFSLFVYGLCFCSTAVAVCI